MGKSLLTSSLNRIGIISKKIKVCSTQIKHSFTAQNLFLFGNAMRVSDDKIKNV